MQQFQWEEGDEQKAETTWATASCRMPLHSQEGLINRFRNSPVMHQSVPAEYKPMVFDGEGNAEIFPGPQKSLKCPWQFRS